MIRILLALAVLFATSPAEAQQKRVLVVSQGDADGHDSAKRNGQPLSPLERAITEIGKQSGLWVADTSLTGSEVGDPQALAKYDLLFFYLQASDTPWHAKAAVPLDWIKKGGAWGQAHSALFSGDLDFFSIFGGMSGGHPWGASETVPLVNMDPAHPIMATVPAEFTFTDEVFAYSRFYPENVHVLFSVNMARSPKDERHVPVAWVRNLGAGRIYHTSLGHSASTWSDPWFRSHLLRVFRWLLKIDDAPGSGDANPEVSALEDAQAFIAFRAAQMGRDPVALRALVTRNVAADASRAKAYVAQVAALRSGQGSIPQFLDGLGDPSKVKVPPAPAPPPVPPAPAPAPSRKRR